MLGDKGAETMKDERIIPGCVVQINPEADNDMFGACLLVVDEVRDWGVQGYVAVPSSKGPRNTWMRPKFEDIEYVGQAVWVNVEVKP